jgi:pimeloyl-ACP methyl ester carboxylesterase
VTIVGANGIEIWYDEVGDPDAPVLLLVSGLGAQAVGYGNELCAAFADRGLRVIRFDNRDVGLSTHHDDWTYTLADMADDAFGLLDALGIERAHVWGASMGGMIAQTMAVSRPDRLLTLTSVMSTTGEPGVGAPDPEILGDLLALSMPAESLDAAIESGVALARLIGSPGALFDEAEHRRRQTEQVHRAYDPAASGRQLSAVLGSPARTEQLRTLAMPTLVMHGTLDRLVDISGGRHTAEVVPGARLIELDGMGHDLPVALWPQFVEATIDHIAAHAA